MAVGKKSIKGAVNDRFLADDYLANFLTESVICFPELTDLFLGIHLFFLVAKWPAWCLAKCYFLRSSK